MCPTSVGNLPRSRGGGCQQCRSGVDQHSTANHAVLTTEKAAVWLARPASGDGYYVALFNLDSGAQTFDYSWKEVGLPETSYRLRDLWEHKDLAPAESLTATLASHASV